MRDLVALRYLQLKHRPEQWELRNLDLGAECRTSALLLGVVGRRKHSEPFPLEMVTVARRLVAVLAEVRALECDGLGTRYSGRLLDNLERRRRYELLVDRLLETGWVTAIGGVSTG